MTNIKISDLKPAGSEFFLNSENYLNELADSELNSINGGIKLTLPTFPTRPPLTITTRLTCPITRPTIPFRA